MKFIKRALDWLNITDISGRLSISNVVVYAILTKIAINPHISLADGAIFGLALLNYAYKRYVVSKEPKMMEVTAEAEREIALLRDDVNKIKLARGLTRSG